MRPRSSPPPDWLDVRVGSASQGESVSGANFAPEGPARRREEAAELSAARLHHYLNNASDRLAQMSLGFAFAASRPPSPDNKPLFLDPPGPTARALPRPRRLPVGVEPTPRWRALEDGSPPPPLDVRSRYAAGNASAAPVLPLVLRPIRVRSHARPISAQEHSLEEKKPRRKDRVDSATGGSESSSVLTSVADRTDTPDRKELQGLCQRFDVAGELAVLLLSNRPHLSRKLQLFITAALRLVEATGQGDSNADLGFASPTSSGRGASSNDDRRGQKRTRESGNGSSGKGRTKSAKIDSKRGPLVAQRGFACHFHILNPAKFSVQCEVGSTGAKYRTCMGPGWPELRRIGWVDAPDKTSWRPRAFAANTSPAQQRTPLERPPDQPVHALLGGLRRAGRPGGARRRLGVRGAAASPRRKQGRTQPPGARGGPRRAESAAGPVACGLLVRRVGNPLPRPAGAAGAM